ncbi:hypothetical protein MPDQ_002658 [Monascus purpureus]|uniref:Uncharacterized protein n=3 Tax=Aspergillaceae TaxID=1131492 RepID=A0A507QNZ8_MONPU|nr:hypothetical protein MPDQ_002658 [Monascus purpureus]
MKSKVSEMTLELHIEVFKNGDNPNQRSHWGFLLAKPEEDFGDLYHVQLIDQSTLWYQLAVREATTIKTRHAIGMCKIARLNAGLRSKVVEIISNEPAPRGDKRRCQDWTIDVLASLEVEELIEAGTAERWNKRVGMNVKDIAKDCGNDWIEF